MSENINAPQTAAADDEIDLRELFSAIWQGKWIIIATTFVFAVLSVIYAINLPNIYRSEALLAPVAEDSSMRLPGQLGGLAALAGVNVGGRGSDKTTLAIEVLKSREFIGRFIDRHSLLPSIMATEKWDRINNKLIFNPELFNEQENKWVRKAKPPFSPEPSLLEGHTAFSRMFSVAQDKTTRLVTVAVQHRSATEAQRILQLLIADINEEMRQRDIKEAEKSIAYLNEQINQTNIADARSMLFSLVEEQTKTLMLANARSEYVFKTLDPAVVPERKAKPARALICILGVMLGGMLSVLFVLIRYFSKK